jgi:S1-C subfamily serine protease
VCKPIATAVALTGLLLGLSGAWAQAPGQQERPRAKAAIGIAFEPTGPEAEPRGLIVREVLPGRPAAKAGLKLGDIITGAGKEKIDTPSSLAKVMASHKPGEKLTFHIVRNGKEMDVPITLGEPLARLPGAEGTIPQQQTGAFLGVQAAPVNELPEPLRQRYNLKDNEGLAIMEVYANSPAADAGLKPGDVIASVNGKRVASADALRQMVQAAGVGKDLNLEVKRGQEKMQMTAHLKAMPSTGLNVLPIPFPPMPGIGDQLVTPPILQAAQRNANLERRIADLEKRVRDLEKQLKQAPK